ncbi:hypothetical protein [Methanococcus maripaludis]|uniref:Uncharacterized protein n=1 Tax=Methanococcus maripaludis TaxID=39152 RepID=A0A7J9PLC5_METMI|nr:hypothetical protein [Methanococcus maripaludis]MBA2864022.1 hypothetical protein [Methanococcus maripaludis]
MLETILNLTINQIQRVIFTFWVGIFFVYLSIKGPEKLKMSTKEFRIMQAISLISISYINLIG